MQTARGISLDRSGYDGPYLTTADGNLPHDPFTGAGDWNYNNTTGQVHSSCTLAAMDGTVYNTW